MPREKMVYALIRYGGASYQDLSIKLDHEIAKMVDDLKMKVVVDNSSSTSRRRVRRAADVEDDME